jgi:hypothetical protein
MTERSKMSNGEEHKQNTEREMSDGLVIQTEKKKRCNSHICIRDLQAGGMILHGKHFVTVGKKEVSMLTLSR